MHTVINTVLPFALVGLVNNDLTMLAVGLVFLSKWRTFAVRFNHIPANFRANLTDLIFKLAMLSFIVRADTLSYQLILAALYVVWLLIIKPLSSRPWMATQALISQFLGITALIWGSDALASVVVLAGIWVVIYATTFHYISSFDEPLAKVVAKIWATIGLQLAWIFWHWNLIYFRVIPQFALVQIALSYVVGDLYTAYVETKLRPGRYRTYLISVIIIAIVMILSGDWTGPLV